MFNLRAIQALYARRDGLKLREIAKMFGITKQRVSQLIAEAERIEQGAGSNIGAGSGIEYELSARIRNALIDNRCRLTPDAVADRFKSLHQLRRVPNLGKKSIAELQEWLVRHGKPPIP